MTKIHRGLLITILLGLAIFAFAVRPGSSAAPATFSQESVVVAPIASPTPTDCSLAWRMVDTPDRAGDAPNGLNSIAVLAANDIWTVGGSTYNTSPIVEHWDGNTWSLVTVPGQGYLTGIVAINANDMWAVGANEGGDSRLLVEHWDGQWQRVSISQPTSVAHLHSVDALSLDDVWAVGDYITPTKFGGQAMSLVEHWDGSSWQIIPSPNPGVPDPNTYHNTRLWGVHAVSASDVWAVGTHEGNPGEVQSNLIIHWDGVSWQQMPAPFYGYTDQLNSIDGSAADDLWAVGFNVNAVEDRIDQLALHWNGSDWQRVSVSYPATTTSGLRGVLSLARDNAWTVSDYVPLNQPVHTLVEHWNGSAWQVIPSPIYAGHTINNLASIAAVSDTDLWAVGDRFPGDPGAIAMHYSVPAGCPTLTPTSTPSATNTPTATATATPTPSPQPTNTPLPLLTDTPQPVATATECAASYRDVPTEYWAYGYIRYLSCHQLVSGYPDGSYRPGSDISRGELARILTLAYGLPLLTPTQPSFVDVPTSHWAYSYIEGLHAAGIGSGYPDGSFRPSRSISRAEIVKLVVAASGIPPYTGAYPEYPDVPRDYWAYQYIKTASQKQWVGGYPTGRFRPASPATRAELAKTVYLALVFPRRSQ